MAKKRANGEGSLRRKENGHWEVQIKPDVHIHHCIRDACGHDISNEDCQTLFTDAVTILHTQHPNLTVRGLDGIIWRAYQIRA